MRNVGRIHFLDRAPVGLVLYLASRRRRSLLLPFLLAYFLSYFPAMESALADTVLLKSGVEIDGKIVNQSRTSIVIRTDQGTRTISLDQVRFVYYGDAYRKQQEELKRKRQEQRLRQAIEQRKKAAEARRRALEEEARRKEEDPAAPVVKEDSVVEKERPDTARTEINQKDPSVAETETETDADAEGQPERQASSDEQENEEGQRRTGLGNPDKHTSGINGAENRIAFWILAGPAELDLLPASLLLRSELVEGSTGFTQFQDIIKKGPSAMALLGLAIPMGQRLSVELEGMVSGYAPQYTLLEFGRNPNLGMASEPHYAPGVGEYRGILRTTGDVTFYYGDLISSWSGRSGEPDSIRRRIKLEALLAYRNVAQDARGRQSILGPDATPTVAYFSETNVSYDQSMQGLAYGFRVGYWPRRDWPLHLQLTLRGISLKGTSDLSLKRKTIYSSSIFAQEKISLAYLSRQTGISLEVSMAYSISSSLELFLRLYHESLEYAPDDLSMEKYSTINFLSSSRNVELAILSNWFQKAFTFRERQNALMFGLRYRL